jgi:hypothetical protein
MATAFSAALVRRRVSRGMAFQDHADAPRWWAPDARDAIDLGRLNMGHRGHCVLGQRYGNYEMGIVLLGLAPAQSVRLGFHARARLFSRRGIYRVRAAGQEYEALTAEFSRQIQARRDAEPAQATA